MSRHTELAQLTKKLKTRTNESQGIAEREQTLNGIAFSLANQPKGKSDPVPTFCWKQARSKIFLVNGRAPSLAFAHSPPFNQREEHIGFGLAQVPQIQVYEYQKG